MIAPVLSKIVDPSSLWRDSLGNTMVFPGSRGLSVNFTFFIVSATLLSGCSVRLQITPEVWFVTSPAVSVTFSVQVYDPESGLKFSSSLSQAVTVAAASRRNSNFFMLRYPFYKLMFSVMPNVRGRPRWTNSLPIDLK